MGPQSSTEDQVSQLQSEVATSRQLLTQAEEKARVSDREADAARADAEGKIRVSATRSATATVSPKLKLRIAEVV